MEGFHLPSLANVAIALVMAALAGEEKGDYPDYP